MLRWSPSLGGWRWAQSSHLRAPHRAAPARQLLSASAPRLQPLGPGVTEKGDLCETAAQEGFMTPMLAPGCHSACLFRGTGEVLTRQGGKQLGIRASTGRWSDQATDCL